MRIDREVDVLTVGAGRTGDTEHVLGLHVAAFLNARDATPPGRKPDARIRDPLHAHGPVSLHFDHGEDGELPVALPQHLHDRLPAAAAPETIISCQV